MDHTRLVSHRETVSFLECVSVFSEIPEEDVEFLAGLSGRVHMPAGEALFEEGDPGDAVFVIRRGKVDVFTHLPNGDELVLAQLGDHELIGEHYLFDAAGGRRSASVRAVQPTDLIRISHDTFDRLMKRNPAIAKQLAWRRMHREQQNLTRRSELYRIICNVPAQTPTVRVSFSPGEVVFHEGDPADGVYLVTRGVAQVYRESAPDVVLSEVAVGQCFGERAVLSDTPRSASVRAKGELDLLRIPKENFVRLHEQSADLQDVVCGLEFSYQLPSRGLALQYTSRQENEDSIERLYRLPDQREFLSSFLVRRKVFRMERLGLVRGPHHIEHSWQDEAAGLLRTLRVGPLGDIVGVVVGGGWMQLPQVIEAALDATPLNDRMLSIFKQTGNLPLEVFNDLDISEPDAIACFCLNIPTARLGELIKAGYSSFEALRKTTGCGSVCGGCEAAICDLLKPPEWIPVAASSAVMSDRLRSFKLVPARRYPEWQAGQHIMVEGRIHGTWVRRPYLISAPAAAGSMPEIIALREPGGHFTPWLFDGPVAEKQLRISLPRGNVSWDAPEGKTVCMVHDLGIIMALSIVRTAIACGTTQPIHVVCFVSDGLFAPLLRSLKDAGSGYGHITVEAVDWPLKSAVKKSLLPKLQSRFEGATYVLCGFGEHLERLRKLVAQMGVSAERVHAEVLFHAISKSSPTGQLLGKLKRLGWVGVAIAALAAAGLLLFSRSVGGWLGG
ncbi:MAG: hypothetical protein RIR70_748 [Pseudomonadota bacterium]|jgi:CRP-like cAMP-binding protein/ferredoxin-NADP reductase/bacterioferritin-associated ferredoxin